MRSRLEAEARQSESIMLEILNGNHAAVEVPEAYTDFPDEIDRALMKFQQLNDMKPWKVWRVVFLYGFMLGAKAMKHKMVSVSSDGKIKKVL